MRVALGLVRLSMILVACSLGGAIASAQPVINDVTGVDVIFSTIGQGVDSVAPGGAASLWGEGVAQDLGSGMYASKVLVNGVEALSVPTSTGRVYFRVPPETAVGMATVTAEVGGMTSAAFPFLVTAYAPTFFFDAEGLHADESPLTPEDPALAGETIIAEGLTGLGAAPNPVVTGTVGGIAAQVVDLEEGIGQFPFPGVFRLTFVVPPQLEPGLHAVTIAVGGVTYIPPDDPDWKLFVGDGGGGGTEAPSIDEGGIVMANLAPLVNTVSALSIIAIFGQDFTPGDFFLTELDEEGKIRTILGGVCVEIGGVRAALYGVFSTQVNAQVPPTETLGPVSVVVIRNCDTAEEQRSEVAMVTVEQATPVFFVSSYETGLIAAQIFPDYVPLAPLGMFPMSRPVLPDEIVIAYGAGWGPTTADLEVGELNQAEAPVLPEANVMATLNGVPVAPENILYIGLAGDSAGLYQLVLRIPEGTPPGEYELVLTVYGKSTPFGTIILVGAPQ